MNCKNCNVEVTTNFCPNCGHPIKLKRIDAHYIKNEIKHILHFEKGFLFTVRELITRPGDNVKHFITENRNRLVKPIIFLFITSLFYSLCNYIFHFEDSYIKNLNHNQSSLDIIFKWIQGHYGYVNLIMGIFIAMWTKLFFRKYQFNLFEIFILLCFIMGLGMLIFSFFGIIQGLTQINLIQLSSIIGIVYFTWAIGQFFDKGKLMSYVKAFFSYLIGMLTFIILAVIIAIIIDLVIKK